MIDLSLANPGESCVGNATLAAYVARELQGAAKANVDRHVARCEACRRAMSDVVRGERPAPNVLADTVAQWSVSTSVEANDNLLVFAAVFALIAAATALLWQVL